MKKIMKIHEPVRRLLFFGCFLLAVLRRLPCYLGSCYNNASVTIATPQKLKRKPRTITPPALPFVSIILDLIEGEDVGLQKQGCRRIESCKQPCVALLCPPFPKGLPRWIL